MYEEKERQNMLYNFLIVEMLICGEKSEKWGLGFIIEDWGLKNCDYGLGIKD